MIRVQRLVDSTLAAIARIDHPPDLPHVDPAEEVTPHYSINLIETGGFSIQHGDGAWTIGAGDVFVTTPGQRHRYMHDEHDGAPTDVCIAVCFKDDARDDIDGFRLGALQPRTPVVPLTNRTAYLRHRLFADLASGADALTFDALAGELLAATLAPGGTAASYQPAQIAWYAPRIDAVRRRLDEEFGAEHTLAALARGAAMSPYHFARVFRELTGVPPHRYLVRRRLAAAAERLRDGASVTDTCFAVGFRSLSHFITAFRRAYGVSPSRLSRQP
jgi:AraC-like DNA-binding protein